MDDTNSVDDFNPILDDDDEAFEGFEKMERSSEPSAEKSTSADESPELAPLEGFKKNLPNPVDAPTDVKRSREASLEMKREGKEAAAKRNSAIAEIRARAEKEKQAKNGGAPKQTKTMNVDEDIEKAEPLVEVVEPRKREKASTTTTKDGEKESLTPGEKWSGVKKQRRYRYVRDNGMIDGAELEFFRQNESSRRAIQRGDSSLDYLRPGFGFDETDEDRRKRIEKVTRAVFGRDAYKRNAKKRWSRKHQETLEFLAKFKYATPRHIAKLFSESPTTTLKRLKELRTYGLIVDKKLLAGEPIWFLTDGGMLLSGYDLPKVTEARITYPMLPHQFAVNHIAANLWGAGINILNEPDYPQKNRVDLKGNEQYGDYVVSEQEIQSSFGKLKLFTKADVYLPSLKDSMARKKRQWEEAGGMKFGPSPEFQQGNEYMWAIYPPPAVRLAYHVPDMVVARPRNEDGTPNAVAVELEIQNKDAESYRKALTAYRYSRDTYKQVVWVCQKASSAKKLKELGREMGMLEGDFLRIVPILTEDGVFKGRDLWTL